MEKVPLRVQLAVATLVVTLKTNERVMASSFTVMETWRKANGKMASQSESTSTPSRMAPKRRSNTQRTSG